eukprot:41397_1
MQPIDDEYLRTQHDKIYNGKDECNINLWYHKIKEDSLQSAIFPLTIQQIEALIIICTYFQNVANKLKPDKENIVERHFSILDNYNNKWGEHILWNNSNALKQQINCLKSIQIQMDLFIKLYTCVEPTKQIAFIPRLSIDMYIPHTIYTAKKLFDCVGKQMKYNKKHGKWSLCKEYYESCWKSMQFENAEDIIELFIRSQHMLDQLKRIYSKSVELEDDDKKYDFNCSLVLQMIPFKHRQNLLELRMFVCSSNPVAITQYQSFMNYNYKDFEAVIFPMSYSIRQKWIALLSNIDDSNCLEDIIINVLCREFDKIQSKLEFEKTKAYCIDFMIIDMLNKTYTVKVVGINKLPIYKHEYGLFVFEEIQEMQIELLLSKNIPFKIQIRLSDTHSKKMEIREILSKHMIEYLFLNLFTSPCNIRQLFKLIVWKIYWLRYIVGWIAYIFNEFSYVVLKCVNYVQQEIHFGLMELFYMLCGGLITLWIKYIINYSLWGCLCMSAMESIEIILIEIVTHFVIVLMTLWFIFSVIVTVLLL